MLQIAGEVDRGHAAPAQLALERVAGAQRGLQPIEVVRHGPRNDTIRSLRGLPSDKALAAVFAGRYLGTPCPMCSNVSGRPWPSTTPSNARSVPAAWRPYISRGISSTIAPSP